MSFAYCVELIRLKEDLYKLLIVSGKSVGLYRLLIVLGKY